MPNSCSNYFESYWMPIFTWQIVRMIYDNPNFIYDLIATHVFWKEDLFPFIHIYNSLKNCFKKYWVIIFFYTFSFLCVVADRQFTRLVHGYLKEKRIPLPACAYHAIHSTFKLDDDFTGYEELEC